MSGAGIGPVAIGADVGTLGVVGPFAEESGTNPDGTPTCPNPAAHGYTSPGSFGLMVATADGGGPAVDSIHISDWLASTAPGTSPHTLEGIGLGSGVGDVVAAYPTITQTDEYNGTVQYAVPDGGAWVIFTVQFDVVVQISVSTDNHNPEEWCG